MTTKDIPTMDWGVAQENASDKEDMNSNVGTRITPPPSPNKEPTNAVTRPMIKLIKNTTKPLPSTSI
jgi:hypothetical protein